MPPGAAAGAPGAVAGLELAWAEMHVQNIQITSLYSLNHSIGKHYSN